MPSEFAINARPYTLPFRQKIQEITVQLRTERASWTDQWQENAKFTNPRRPRFNQNRPNIGGRKNRYIIDGAGTRACRTAVAGMSSGITPSSRPWFLFGHPNRELREQKEVKAWLYDTAAECRAILTKTNFYQAMPSFYMDMLTFSNAALLVEDDKDDVLRFTCLPMGEWAIANDHRMQAKTFMREFQLSVRQTVEKFCTKKDGEWDFTNVSDSVKYQFVNGQTETWVQIVHVITPNDLYSYEKIGPQGKKYLSVYYERSILNERAYGDYGGSAESDQILRVAGYDMFPVLVGRWGLTDGDCYGSWGPTDVAIGDIRELQFVARIHAEAAVNQIKPPLVGSSRLNKKKGRLPEHNTVTWLNSPTAADSLRRIYDFPWDTQHAVEWRQDIRNSVNEAFFVDVFRRFTSTNRQHMTAKQVAEEQQEKLIELSPLLELLNVDVLDPLIEMLFVKSYKAKRLPEAPEQLAGQDLEIQYTSILHQAQKLLDAGNYERFLGLMGSVIQIAPEALDKINIDEVVEGYHSIASAPPEILRSDKEVADIRGRRAEQQRKEAELQDALEESEVAKNLGGAEVSEGQTALGAIAGG